MPGGRPLKFATPEIMQEKIDAYFNLCCNPDGTLRLNENGHIIKPPSITGLALALDTYRDLLCNYEERDEFHDTIKKAKQRVENFYEERLMHGSPAGPIFALKNFDWTDTQTHAGDPKKPLQVEMGAGLIADAILRIANK